MIVLRSDQSDRHQDLLSAQLPCQLSSSRTVYLNEKTNNTNMFQIC